MLQISCPWCGTRPEGEFICLGEAVPPRPDPAALSEAEWAAALANRANIRGLHAERWWHVRSCGRILTIWRDTVSHAIVPPPDGTAVLEVKP
jgi:heterotetrameric sarcosine oxidase delta subunit